MIFLKIWRSRMVRAHRALKREFNDGLVFVVLYNFTWKAETFQFCRERYLEQRTIHLTRSEGLDWYFALDEGLQWDKRFKARLGA